MVVGLNTVAGTKVSIITLVFSKKFLHIQASTECR